MLHVPPGWNKINICIWQNLVSTSHVDAVGQIYQTNFNQAYSNYITACPQLIWKFSTRPELPSVAFKKASRLYISCKKNFVRFSETRKEHASLLKTCWKTAKVPLKSVLTAKKISENTLLPYFNNRLNSDRTFLFFHKIFLYTYNSYCMILPKHKVFIIISWKSKYH